jgi:hypothetical protein
MIDRSFVIGGKAIFTVELPADWAAANRARPHYTFKVTRKEPAPGSRFGDTYFISLLTGPDNTGDFTYVGILDVSAGAIIPTKASRLEASAVPVRLLARVLNRLWAEDSEAIEAAGFAVHHEGRCCRCGRRLTTPESVASGIGPECARMVAAVC